MTEFALIDKIRSRCKVPQGVLGIGDDCAIIPQHAGQNTLVSTDMLIEDVHFIFDRISPYDLGWKSAAVNISDIAAMGGRPTGIFLSIALTSKVNEPWMDSFMDGFLDLCSKYGCPLLGGDTCKSLSALSIGVTVLGESACAARRSSARPGDLICVTGTLGDSAAGLKLLLEIDEPVPATFPVKDTASQVLLDKHFRPLPQIEKGQALLSSGYLHAMMDISDGVASDIRHILDESSCALGTCGARIQLDKLPLSPQLQSVCKDHNWDPVSLAIEGGEDYELLFTVAPEGLEIAQKYGTVIGEITTSGRLEWIGADQCAETGQCAGTSRDYKGFTHF